MSKAAIQTKVQWCGEDQDYWQHIHGCCWPEWDTWSRAQSGREADASNHLYMTLSRP